MRHLHRSVTVSLVASAFRYAVIKFRMWRFENSSKPDIKDCLILDLRARFCIASRLRRCTVGYVAFPGIDCIAHLPNAVGLLRCEVVAFRYVTG